MRLSSISFTHASTAMFGVAVTAYAALRLAGYDVPHGDLALSAPHAIERGPDTPLIGSGSRQQSKAVVGPAARDHHPGHDEGPASGTPHRIARLDDRTSISASWSRDNRNDPTTDGQSDPESPDTSSGDDSAHHPSGVASDDTTHEETGTVNTDDHGDGSGDSSDDSSDDSADDSSDD